MPQIVLDGTGPTKSSLVEGAYTFCGLNGFEYERTPEEMTAGLIALNDIMAELLADGIDLGYDFPTYANGLPEEASGIPASAAGIVKKLLAQALCPGLGATLSDDAKAAFAKSYQGLRSRTAAAPPSMKTLTPMPSSGVRHTTSPIIRDIDTLSDPGDLSAIVGS